MNELKTQAKALRAQIETAFANVPYPGDDNIAPRTQMDDDYDDVIVHLTGKHWRDLIPKRKPPKGRSNPISHSLCFATSEAWLFFLPAYMIADIMMGRTDFREFDPGRSEQLNDHIESRFRLLNAEQCTVIASFLSYAVMRLNENQIKYPNHYKFFERERQHLVVLIDYWSARARIVAKSV